jgi:hypothetical protein
MTHHTGVPPAALAGYLELLLQSEQDQRTAGTSMPAERQHVARPRAEERDVVEPTHPCEVYAWRYAAR